MMDTDESLQSFILARGLRMSVKWADRNPHMDGSDDMDNWKYQIRNRHHSLSGYFSKGVGHHGAEPTLAEVLDCLASDAAGVENARSFEEWCGEYGYDTDSRKAHRIYRLCERQAERLKDFFGDADYRKLLWETERL